MSGPRIPELWANFGFWIVAVGAAAFKTLTATPPHNMRTGLISFGAGVFAAIAFGDAAISHFNLSGSRLELAAVALVALTGEHAMRLVIAVAADPVKSLDLLRRLRNGGGDAK